MNSELTEAEMRRALFGSAEVSAPIAPFVTKETVPDIVIIPPGKAAPKKKKVPKAFTPRLKVTLRVGNEFEGETFDITHEADTLSTLLAEQEAVKAARTKYRYVEVVSVESM
jgi:hypothetical protein